VIPLKRINQLRVADVYIRISRGLSFCESILGGTHPYFRFLGELAWLHDHPTKTFEDYHCWKSEVFGLAKKRAEVLRKRLNRLKEIELKQS